MENINYLYGAAVQGIQSFIFQTNELKDIVGASELVTQICTSKFRSMLKNYNDDQAIVMAAGNIKYIFASREECESIVHDFPKQVMEMAPGITISQAVVAMIGEYKEFKDAVLELEMRLRIQRNKPIRSMTMGLTGIVRSGKTGLPAVNFEKQDNRVMYIDLSTQKKLSATSPNEENSTEKLCIKLFSNSPNDLLPFIPTKQIAYDIEKLCGKNDWIAIIHADGNGLGRVIQKIGNDPNKLRDFSRKLDIATIAAAQTAYKMIKNSDDEIRPIRPIVLGGDDLTIICRADVAIPFTKVFIEEFENQTKKLLGRDLLDNCVFNNKEDKMTACAGIAFIKSSYPFHYGYQLAEKLCSKAKEDAKKKARQEVQEEQQDGCLAKSCLMFHKVQSSYIENYDEIVKKELTASNSISFKYGPYYLTWTQQDQNSWGTRWTIEDLAENISKLDSKEGGTVKTHLREWLGLLINNIGPANQKLSRLKQMLASRKEQKEIGELLAMVELITSIKESDKRIPVYDMLSLHSIINQETK